MTVVEDSEATKQRWVHVHSAPFWEAQLLKNRLEGAGIPAYLPDSNAMNLEGEAHNGSMFATTICVPSGAVDAAVEVLTEYGIDLRASARASASPTRHELEVEERRIEALGARIRFAALSVLTLPWALVVAADYFRATRAIDWRPSDHAWNLSALAAGASAFVSGLALVVELWLG